MMSLRVSENGRFLVREDGSPFFYMGDTAWELFHRPGREEADLYLRNRAAKGFTVVQAVALAEHDGLTEPNAYGHLPLRDADPGRPNEAYFEHVDFVVERAAELGLFVGMLPTWGDKWNRRWGVGPEVFTPENARTYGEFLGRRYREAPIVWILGGDRVPETGRHRAVIRAMARGLEAGDGGRHLVSFHPSGGRSSAEFFHREPWLDFDMLQSGHARDAANHEMVERDYARSPIKPCMDAEPGYEDHPDDFDPEKGYLTDADVRKSAYRALFAGAHGHTYGCHDVWQFFDPALRPPITHARTPWREALDLPGARQMGHVRRLVQSRPFLTRVPDQSLLVSGPGAGPDRVRATRDSEGGYAFVYIPTGEPVTVDPGTLNGDKARALWYDPRSGTAEHVGEFGSDGTREFAPPTRGPGEDWVLILDDAARDFPFPGDGS